MQVILFREVLRAHLTPVQVTTTFDLELKCVFIQSMSRASRWSTRIRSQHEAREKSSYQKLDTACGGHQCAQIWKKIALWQIFKVFAVLYNLFCIWKKIWNYFGKFLRYWANCLDCKCPNAEQNLVIWSHRWSACSPSTLATWKWHQIFHWSLQSIFWWNYLQRIK